LPGQKHLYMEATSAYASVRDQADDLREFRSQFFFPSAAGDNNAGPVRHSIYFCGNSLGLQPKGAAAKVEGIMEAWKKYGVAGYSKGPAPWMQYGQRFKKTLSEIAGCLEGEVTVMNTLTVNLHLLLCSFYKPTSERYKILIEAGAFPSDQYAAETQVTFHGLDPDAAIIEVAPREGEKLVREEDLEQAIREAGPALSMVLVGGVSYYTGQFFDMERITRAAHAVGALAGFDLAHAVGNVPLSLHDWDVDFAVWCSYKYLNGGPGAAGAAYIHERFSGDPHVHRFGGWGGSNALTRFQMPKAFSPEPGADGWNLSVAQGLVMAGLEASLELFEAAGMDRIRSKSLELTGYLEYLLDQVPGRSFEIVTPTNPAARGSQLSLFFPENGAAVQAALAAAGIITDYREPGVIRISPAPLYNSFEDVYRLYSVLCSA
jgi:kynureninase